jgi:hypothetical protein
MFECTAEAKHAQEGESLHASILCALVSRKQGQNARSGRLKNERHLWKIAAFSGN